LWVPCGLYFFFLSPLWRSQFSFWGMFSNKEVMNNRANFFYGLPNSQLLTFPNIFYPIEDWGKEKKSRSNNASICFIDAEYRYYYNWIFKLKLFLSYHEKKKKKWKKWNEKKEKIMKIWTELFCSSRYPACLFLMCHAPEGASIKHQILVAPYSILEMLMSKLEWSSSTCHSSRLLIEWISSIGTRTVYYARYAPAPIAPRVLDNDTCPHNYKCTFCMIRHTTMHERCIEGRT
jgi:hypothetical protein